MVVLSKKPILFAFGGFILGFLLPSPFQEARLLMLLEEFSKQEDQQPTKHQWRQLKTSFLNHTEASNLTHRKGTPPVSSTNSSSSTLADEWLRHRLFNPGLKGLVAGASRVKAKQFMESYDMGFPIHESDNVVEDVLVLHSDEQSLPSNYRHSTPPSGHAGGGMIPMLTADEATTNCDIMYVVSIQRQEDLRGRRQCLALLGQHPDFTIHSHKFMRVAKQDGDNIKRKPDWQEKLRHVGLGVGGDGTDIYTPSRERNMKFHFRMLPQYLTNYETMVQDIRVIVDQIAKNNTVVAITVNFGYSDLMMNWICQARSRGLDLSHVLVFATDPETKALVEGFGISAYYNDKVCSLDCTCR